MHYISVPPSPKSMNMSSIKAQQCVLSSGIMTLLLHALTANRDILFIYDQYFRFNQIYHLAENIPRKAHWISWKQQHKGRPCFNTQV